MLLGVLVGCQRDDVDDSGFGDPSDPLGGPFQRREAEVMAYQRTPPAHATPRQQVPRALRRRLVRVLFAGQPFVDVLVGAVPEHAVEHTGPAGDLGHRRRTAEPGADPTEPLATARGYLLPEETRARLPCEPVQ